MKKSILAVGLIIVIGAATSTFEATYSRTATCTGCTQTVCTFEDTTGNVWEWEIEPNEDFEVGCSYKLIMDDNHTSDITDDWIKKNPKKIEKRG